MAELLALQPSSAWFEIRSEESDWTAVGREAALQMLQHSHIIRAFEETGLELVNEGLVHGPWHCSAGQEGGAVGAMSVLGSEDQIAGAHRGHHLFLAKALRYIARPAHDPLAEPIPDDCIAAVYRTLSEILGLAEGFCGGRGGSMHLRWRESGNLGTNAIVGGGVPFANGVAWSRKTQGRPDVVVTFIGDGAVNMGAVTESMNMAALYRLPICFFIENNLYAIATTVAESSREIRLSSRGGAFGIPAFRVDGMDPVAVRVAMQKALGIMRGGEGPTLIEAELYRFYHHTGSQRGSAFGYRSKEEEEAWRLRDPLIRQRQELIKRGWLTAGEDEHLRTQAKEMMKAIVARIMEPVDNKRRRIRPHLWPDPRLRDAGVRSDGSELKGLRYEEIDTHRGRLESTKFIKVIADVVARRMQTDPRIVVLGEDIHRLRGGTNGATRGLVERFSGRVIATPISEQAFLGLAGGAATDGHLRPIVELMYSDFVMVAADQAFNQIAKARHMFGGTTDMPLVVRSKVALGGGYGSQHSMDPAGLYSSWPGWRIVAPSNPFDYVGLMNTALASEDPVLVIEHTDLYASSGSAPVEDLDYFVPFGKARCVRAGTAFTVLTYLSMVPLAVQVADKLGIDAEVIDLRSLDRASLDWDTIGASIRKTNNVVVIEQGPLVCSYGAMLTDEIQRRLFDELDQPVKRIFGGFSSPSVSAVLESACIVGAKEIEAGYLQMLADQGLPAGKAAQKLAGFS
jgi:2-oxoisovalerate dehydrogenase E1 component